MSRSGFENVLARHLATAAKRAPSLAEKCVTPHMLRHSCAMHTLQATGDVRKVSLWLGNASIQRTEIDLRADPTEKLEMVAGVAMPKLKPALPPAGQAARAAGRQGQSIIMRSWNREKQRRRNPRRPQLRITIRSAYYRIAE